MPTTSQTFIPSNTVVPVGTTVSATTSVPGTFSQTNTTTASFLGLAYPIVADPRGLFYPVSGSQSIKGSLLSIFLTNQNERVMMTDFGCNLTGSLFELAGPAVEQTVYNNITDQINLFEPRITVANLTVTTTPSDPSLVANNDPGNQTLYINISWNDPDNITTVQDLVLEIPLS